MHTSFILLRAVFPQQVLHPSPSSHPFFPVLVDYSVGISGLLGMKVDIKKRTA